MTSVESKCAVFITFSGNCRKALTAYQKCFGGELHLEPFERPLHPYKEQPIVIGTLVADRITIYGSDMVHDEGRRIGNYLSIYVHFEAATERLQLIRNLEHHLKMDCSKIDKEQPLIELTDAFDVRWVLGL